MSLKPNAIIGAVRGYSYAQLEPFILSLRRTSFDGDVVLLWNSLSDETLDALRNRGIKLEPFHYRGSGAINTWSRFWPLLRPVVRACPGSVLARGILKSILPLQTARFFAYRDFLSAHKDEYQHILLTDVRDVLFQDDPFRDFKGDLMVFEEYSKLLLADEKEFNARWLEATFGAKALAEVGHFPILCSGTIMGDASAISRFLHEFEDLVYRCEDISLSGSDQGLFNYLCRIIMDPWFCLSKNGEGPVLTMNPLLKNGVDFSVSDTGLILGPHGRPAPVLHQYDRHPELVSGLLSKLAGVVPIKKSRS